VHHLPDPSRRLLLKKRKARDFNHALRMIRQGFEVTLEGVTVSTPDLADMDYDCEVCGSDIHPDKRCPQSAGSVGYP